MNVEAALGAWRTILGPTPEVVHAHWSGELWKVVASDGRAYFLKQLSPWRNLPIADEIRVIEYLVGKGVPVARYMVAGTASLICEHDGDTFVLMPEVPSSDLDQHLVPESDQGIGSALARLQQHLAAYPWSANSYTENLAESLVASLVLPDSLRAQYLSTFEHIASVLEGLPSQLVHGDMTPDNVLLSGPGIVSAFIDFDHLPLAPKIWDIAKFLSRRIRLGWRNDPQSDRIGSVGPFVRGYSIVSTLSNHEVNALPWLITAANVLEASYHHQILDGSLQRRRLPNHEQVLADTVDAARWSLEHVEDIAARVQSGIEAKQE